MGLVQKFRDSSISQKLTLIIVATSVIVLLLASVTFVAYSLVSFQRQLVRDTSVLARLIGLNTAAALTFNHTEEATETLSALNAESGIQLAYLLDRNGKLVAKYIRHDTRETPLTPIPVEQGHQFLGDYLHVYQTIESSGEPVGTIYIQANLNSIYNRLYRYIGIAGVVLVASTLIAILLSSQLRRIITEPILYLADVASHVSTHKNYAVRAVNPCTDELGLLINRFNDMLEQIQERDLALQRAHDQLEERVRDRTAELRHEITERRRTEYELQIAKDLAESASHAKSEFLANMSHEIRTPLNAIIGMTELTIEMEMPGEQRQFLEVIQSSSTVLLRVINDILDFSKIEAGQMELETHSFNLRKMVEEVADILGGRAHDKNLELLCYVDPGLPRLYLGDATRVGQILVNLVGNAIKFTEEGEVSIKVEPMVSVGETLSGERRQTLHFTVRDTGIGVSEEDRAKIFGKFVQADGSITRRYGGTGLGLSISQSLVELMGGRIWIESQMGQGSVFHFTLELPVAVETDRFSEMEPMQVIANTSVLVVDDNATNRFILNKSLTSWGITVFEASSGQEALIHLAGNPGIRLVILDYQMPEMDGLALAHAIRSTVPQTQPRLILLSSGGEIPDDRLAGLDIATTMTKPVRQSRLFDVVVTTLDTEKSLTVPVATSEITVQGDLSQNPLYRILLVEDNRANQLLARRLLEQIGYTVDIAEDGQMAVDRVGSQHYDVIVMDIQMPVMDGFAATKAIRLWENDHQLPRTPVIALTAHAIEGYREECIKNGMDDYITKPIKKSVLLNTVAQWADPRPAVLIVDDAAENRLLIQKILERDLNVHLLFANNGQEALEMARRRPPALVLLDMEMPVMDGYKTASLLRNLEGDVYKHLPVIALTAHQGEDEVKKCLHAGCTSYLSKPVRRQALIDLIHVYLGPIVASDAQITSESGQKRS